MFTEWVEVLTRNWAFVIVKDNSSADFGMNLVVELKQHYVVLGFKPPESLLWYLMDSLELDYV